MRSVFACIVGQISFFLLCMQFVRAQMQNINYKPYGGMSPIPSMPLYTMIHSVLIFLTIAWLRDRRARKLVERYPQYDRLILEDFARNDSFEHDHAL